MFFYSKTLTLLVLLSIPFYVLLSLFLPRFCARGLMSGFAAGQKTNAFW